MEVVWSNNQISMLIELYRQHSNLWDASDKEYKDKNKKNDAWTDIAAKLHKPQKEVEIKMYILRSQFSREKKKNKTSKRTGNGCEEVIRSKWQWFEPLQFLLCGATTSGTSDTMETDGSGSMELTKSPLPVPLSPTASQLPASTPPSSLLPPLPLSQSKKRKCINSINEEYEIIRSAKMKMHESKDEFDVYAQYVASELRNVKNLKTVLQAKYYINNIMLQARMGNFDDNFFAGYRGCGWQEFGGGYHTTSSTSTYADASTPTHTPEPQTGIYTDEMQFSNNKEIFIKFEDDT